MILFVFFIFAMLSPPALAAKLLGDTIVYLAQAHEFPIAPGEDPVLFLQNRIRTLHQALSVAPDSPEADVLRLELGDVYHWLGHVADDRNAFELAVALHQKSYEQYAKSRFATSWRINNLVGIEHATFHIRKSTRRKSGLRPEGKLELYLLQRKHGWNFPAGVDVTEFLESRQKELFKGVSVSQSTRAQVNNDILEIADIYFWLGMIAQEHLDVARAKALYESALVYYRQTGLVFSERLLDHPKFGRNGARQAVALLADLKRAKWSLIQRRQERDGYCDSILAVGDEKK